MLHSTVRRMGFGLAMIFMTMSGVQSLAAQDRQLTGRVVSEQDVPLNGAAISVVGTQIGTFSNQNGQFTLMVPSGPVRIRVSYLGYRATDVMVEANQSTLTVEMEIDVLNLDAVVVTGQVTSVARRNSANAVSQVNAEQLTRTPAASIEQQLTGKIAGADIQSNSGAPGGGLQIRLRGVSSIIGSATPLYVVDGVVVSDATIQSGTNVIQRASGGAFRSGMASTQDNAANRIADLNPADIESIEILKGASAAAIYGSKASAGVILINTKRGRAGETDFTMTQRVGGSQMSNQLGARRFDTLEDAVEVFGTVAADHWEAGRVFDHEQELAGGTALSHETALSARGGTEATRFFASALLKRDGGVITNTGYDKESLRLNIDQSLGDRAQLRLNMNGVHSSTQRGFTNNDNRSVSYWMALTGTPSFVDLRQREDGTFPVNPFANSNPLQTAALAVNNEDVWRTIASADLTIDAYSSNEHTVNLLLNGGVDYFSQKNNVFSPGELQFEPLDGNTGTTFQGNATSLNLNYTASLVHRLTPGSGLFAATTSLGVQIEDRDVDIMRVVNEDLIPGQTNIDAGTSPGVFQQQTRVKDRGIFAQEELLLLDERLLLVGGIRMDRSSNNADTEQYFTYPKFAASYRFPDFLPGTIDEVKIRTAWGQTGNQPQFGQKFSNLNVGNMSGLQTLRIATTTAATDLRPERQREIEAGVDLTLLDRRGILEVTYFNRRLTDLLLNRALPPSTGYNTAIFNGGVMQSNGWEVALQAIPFQSENLSWNSRITFSTVSATIEELPVPPFAAGGFGTALGGFQIANGKSPTQIVGRDTVAVANDPRCDGPCEVGDRILATIGDSNPDFRMGISNEFRRGNLSLYGLIDWQKGGDVVNLTGWLLDLSQNAADYTDPCTASTCAAGESLGQYRARVYPGRVSTIWVEDASFVKVREVTLGYDVPLELVSRVWDDARHLRLNLSGRNLLTLTDYTGMDPEVSNFGQRAIGRNIDVAPYPPSRSFWLSVDIGF